MDNEDRSILVVEDDGDLQELIKLAGNKNGYKVELSGNGLEAKKMIEAGRIPNIIILDINMPGMDGLSFCRWLRDDHPRIPVIFLSARTGEFDKILALEIGGDDYLTKPFSMKELFARIAVSLRRIDLYRSETGDQLSVDAAGDETGKEDGELVMDRESWICRYRGESVSLTVSEFRILHKMTENSGMVISRESLARAAFPDDRYNTGRSIDIHVSRIRSKLQVIDPSFHSIETVYQVGYKWTG